LAPHTGHGADSARPAPDELLGGGGGAADGVGGVGAAVGVELDGAGVDVGGVGAAVAVELDGTGVDVGVGGAAVGVGVGGAGGVELDDAPAPKAYTRVSLDPMTMTPSAIAGEEIIQPVVV
jgi:hypothetical protein